MSDNIEKLSFNAEVHKVLNLVINHIYTNQDIFVRELISNASDACDKMRHMLLEKGESEEIDNFKIQCEINKDHKKITITDNGIGMTKEELCENLGTIAKSGTKKFLDALQDSKNSDLIGQFGVGFYSAFMAADKVQVISRKFDADDAWIWESEGKDHFTIKKYEEPFERGTKIILDIKEDADSYLDRYKIEHIINTYSDHIKFPIELFNDKGEAEKINDSAALWVESKENITPEKYNDFFKSVAKIGGEPWMILHNKNEGMVEFTNLLFIPSIKPFDLFNPERRCSVKLYVKRVFITEDNANIVPRYMRFVRGVVDSEDLSLNISRENLQENSTIDRIRNAITKKILNELKKKLKDEKEDYISFWNNFGAVLKEGLCEPMDNESRQRLLDTCLFFSLQQNKLITLDEYIDNKKENQNQIFFITGNDLDVLKESPQLEGFIKRDIDVLLLNDAVDDFWTSVVQDYKTSGFKSATQSDINLNEIVFLKEDEDNKDENDESEETKKAKEDYHQLIENCFKDNLGEQISKVIISKKLTSSPICLVNEAGKMSSRMERFMMEQNQLNRKSPKVLEVNANHKIVKNLMEKFKANKDDIKVKNTVFLLFSQACILEGESIDDPVSYAKKLNSLLEESV